MTITKYYCDHCGNEIGGVDSPVTMVAVGVDMFHVCADCAADLKAFIGTAKHTKPPLGLVPQEWLDELNEKTRKEEQNHD